MNRINDLVQEINSASEKYQLIHATFAIEKIFKKQIEDQYKFEFDKISNALRDPAICDDEVERLMKKAASLREESCKGIKILVDYIPQMHESSARITRTPNNTFMIVLPQTLENTRGSDGKIDFEKLSKLRELMAHELGHVVLHSGVLVPCNDEINEGSEEEAKYFAERMIVLRRRRNEEIYHNRNFEHI